MLALALLCFLFLSPSLSSSTIRSNSPVYALGTPVSVSWSVASAPTASDWIGAFARGSNVSQCQPVATRGNAGALAQGSTDFVGLPEGLYVFYYFAGAGCGAVVAHATDETLVVQCAAAGSTQTAVKHVVLVVYENEAFDTQYGLYCKGGANPTCNVGPSCCEAAPAPLGVLTDQVNGALDPCHSAVCETCEINGGRMDRYVAGCPGSAPTNKFYKDATTGAFDWSLASQYALADRYFQPMVGSSWPNDMFFATARAIFTQDNFFAPAGAPNTGPGQCTSDVGAFVNLNAPNLGDMMRVCGVSQRYYGEGYQAMADAAPNCPPNRKYTEFYSSSDVAFNFWPQLQSNMADFSQFATDLKSGQLPAFSLIKPVWKNSQHPGSGVTLSDGQRFLQNVLDLVGSSSYASNTLILLVPDESGGFFDHVPPPLPSPVDGQHYGPRIPLIVAGPFAKTNYISHVQMEHSSVVRFVEYNFFGGRVGQLGNRDAIVNNLFDLLQNTAIVPSCSNGKQDG